IEVRASSLRSSPTGVLRYMWEDDPALQLQVGELGAAESSLLEWKWDTRNWQTRTAMEHGSDAQRPQLSRIKLRGGRPARRWSGRRQTREKLILRRRSGKK